MVSLRESVHDGKDDQVTRGTRQPHDKVQSDQGQKPRSRLVTAFRTRTNAHNILMCIPLQQRPSKGQFQQRHHMTNARVTGEVRSVQPMQDTRAHGGRNK